MDVRRAIKTLTNDNGEPSDELVQRAWEAVDFVVSHPGMFPSDAVRAALHIIERRFGKVAEKHEHSWENLPIFKAMRSVPGLVIEEDGQPVPIPSQAQLEAAQDIVDGEVVESDEGEFLDWSGAA